MKFSEKITIVIGIGLVAIFVIGLAWSISTGLAGFWRGLPFWVIVIFCLYLLILDSIKAIKNKYFSHKEVIKRKKYIESLMARSYLKQFKFFYFLKYFFRYLSI